MYSTTSSRWPTHSNGTVENFNSACTTRWNQHCVSFCLLPSIVVTRGCKGGRREVKEEKRAMGFGALRSILRPLSRKAHLTRPSLPHFASVAKSPQSPSPSALSCVFYSSLQNCSYTPLPWAVAMMMRWNGPCMGIHSLTDTRFPKRRPGTKPRRKRASLRPPGPYAWVQYVPGEPIPRSRPNEGSVQGRNRIKRIRQRKAFIKSEAKKRKAQLSEAKRRKHMKRIERKMAAVARERAWAERLAELQTLEAEAKKTEA